MQFLYYYPISYFSKNINDKTDFINVYTSSSSVHTVTAVANSYFLSGKVNFLHAIMDVTE